MPQPPDYISASKKMHKEYKYFRWTCTGRERWQTWAIGNSKIYGCPKGHRMKKGVEVHVNEVLRDVFGNETGNCDD